MTVNELDTLERIRSGKGLLPISFLDCINNVDNADAIIAAEPIHDGGRS